VDADDSFIAQMSEEEMNYLLRIIKGKKIKKKKKSI